jgi:hypothetical protein
MPLHRWDGQPDECEKTLLFDGRSIGCALARVNGTIAAKDRQYPAGFSPDRTAAVAEVYEISVYYVEGNGKQ